jgi:hypothetical protein
MYQVATESRAHSNQKRLFCMISADLKHTSHMLMLRVNFQKSLFERIGIGLLLNYNKEATVRVLLSTLSEQETTFLPCLRHDNGMYTVQIINIQTERIYCVLCSRAS